MADLNLNNPNALASSGLESVTSTAPPYTPIVGTPLTQQLTATEQAQALSPGIPNQEAFTYLPIDTTNTWMPSSYPIAPASAGSAAQSGTAQASTAQANTAQANTSYANAATAPNADPFAAHTYNAELTGAAQGTVDPLSQMQNQYSLLTKGVTDGEVPDWARTAVTASRQAMTGMGLGNSTMAAGSMEAAILDAARPMAQFNASVYATLNLQNLANVQASLLSNQAAINAAKQFNAASQNQVGEFFSSLNAQINDQNANRITAVSTFNAGQANQVSMFNTGQANQVSMFNTGQANQVGMFNTGQANQVGMFNAGQANQVNEFNANLAQQASMFNTQNQLLVDQSNVQWQRAVNTANTAGQNAANNANAANLFNLSQTDMNNLWQQARDEASWSLTSGENSQNRLLSLVSSALNRQTSLSILSSQLNANMFSQLGAFATNLLGGSFGTTIGNGIGSLFGSNSKDTFSPALEGSGAGADIATDPVTGATSDVAPELFTT